jgi:phenylacetic acid degradation operon negative regulatory protein
VSQEESVSQIERPARFGASAPAPDPAVARWIRGTLARVPPRAPSLIVTVWGDALAPHGGSIWLRDLIDLLGPFGVSERLTRTSVFRLTRDGWLRRESHGRQSRYRLTMEGERRFAAAYRKIYAASTRDWNARWELLLVRANGLGAPMRHALRDELHWAGFALYAPGAYARPARGGDELASLVERLGVTQAVTIVDGGEASSLAPLAARIGDGWDLSAVERDYRRFLARFGGVIDRFRMRGADASDPEQCFVVRTLLIHAYRRVLLRDPQLPGSLLPLDWPGAAAHALTRDFYQLTLRRAESHLAQTLALRGERWPTADDAFYARFGGLDR